MVAIRKISALRSVYVPVVLDLFLFKHTTPLFLTIRKTEFKNTAMGVAYTTAAVPSCKQLLTMIKLSI